MPLDKLALICVVILAAIWCVALLTSAVAVLPYGLIILAVLCVGGYFVYRVIRDRLENKEDDYYEKNVDK